MSPLFPFTKAEEHRSDPTPHKLVRPSPNGDDSNSSCLNYLPPTLLCFFLTHRSHLPSFGTSSRVPPSRPDPPPLSPLAGYSTRFTFRIVTHLFCSLSASSRPTPLYARSYPTCGRNSLLKFDTAGFSFSCILRLFVFTLRTFTFTRRRTVFWNYQNPGSLSF